jgi:hypothetical protein
MRIEIAKHPNGKGVLRCTRADGSIAWQRQSERHALHFVHHDITHYAAESELGLTRAFFGLVAAGWEIDDTTGAGSRGPLPDEAIFAEHLVGLLDVERATLTSWPADYVVEQLEVAGVPGLAEHRGLITDAALARIRARRAELSTAWHELAEGSTLVLPFPAPSR